MPTAQPVRQEVCDTQVHGPVIQVGGTDGGNVRIEVGTELASLHDFTADVLRLERLADEALSQLEGGLTTIPAPQSPVSVHRRTTADEARTRAGSFLLTGEPGAGKTVLLYEVARKAAAEGRPVVFVSVGSMAAASIGTLQTELGLSHPLVDVLEQWQPGRAGLVAIDALDAARADASTTLWRTIIEQVHRRLPNWQVVVSIRTWDLQYSRQLRALFPENAVSVGDLTDEEVAQVTAAFPALQDLIECASGPLQQLLRNPFNLRLAAELLLDGTAATQLGTVDSRLGLLDRYWESRVRQGVEGIAKEVFLGRVCAAAVQSRRLAVPAQKVLAGDTAASGVLRNLLSSSVLIQAPAIMGRTAAGPVQFAHHVLFDYAVAVTYLTQFPDGLEEGLRADPDLLLFARPSIDMYLRKVWAQEPGLLCRLSLALMGLSSTGMPATAVADIVVDECDRVSDLEVLLQPDPGAEQKAKRVLDAIAIVVSLKLEEGTLRRPGVWVRVAECLSRRPAQVLSVLWGLVTKLASHRAVLVEEDLRLCALAARRLLDHLWAQPPLPASRLAITAVIQTAAADPAAAETLLRRAVQSPQLEERGYFDLHVITYRISELADLLPGLVEDLYVATISHTETSTADTQMGSGTVLPLISNRQQDFDTAKYPLVQYFPALLQSNMPCSSAILTRLSVVGHGLPQHSVVLCNRNFVIVRDDSRLRDYGPSYTYSDPIAVLDAYQNFASAAAAPQAQELVNALAAAPQAGVVWRRTLRAAAVNPALATCLIDEPADCVALLHLPDLFGPACHLIGVLHATAEPSEAARLETAVLSLKPDASDSEESKAQDRYQMLIANLSTERLTNPVLAADTAREDTVSDVGSHFLGAAEPLEPVLEDPAEAELRKLITALGEFASTYLNNTASPEDTASAEGAATDLEAVLPQAESSAIRAEAEDALARAAEVWTRDTQTPPSTLAHARALLLQGATSPRPVPSPDNASYRGAIPQGPRIHAARGLGQLARRPEQYSPAVAQALLTLAVDPVGAIRHTVARIAPFVGVSDATTAWKILEECAAQEFDDAVLAVAVDTAFEMNDRQHGLLILATVMGRVTPHSGHDNAASMCASNAGLLWVHLMTPGAAKFITEMITRWPSDSTWTNCLHRLRTSGALTHEDDTVRQRALALMQQLAEPALDATRHALARSQTFTDTEREQLKNTLSRCCRSELDGWVFAGQA